MTDRAAIRKLPAADKELRKKWQKLEKDRATRAKNTANGISNRRGISKECNKHLYNLNQAAIRDKKTPEQWAQTRLRARETWREKQEQRRATNQPPEMAERVGGGGFGPLPPKGRRGFSNPLPPPPPPPAPPAPSRPSPRAADVPVTSRAAGSPPAPAAAAYTRRHSHPG